jgi:hypothetical protein
MACAAKQPDGSWATVAPEAGAKNPVYESMTRVVYHGYTVRVWREEPKFTTGPDKEVQNLTTTAFDLYHDVALVVAALAGLPRVAAIEVLDSQGHGGLFYPDWH